MPPTFDHAIDSIDGQRPPAVQWADFCQRLVGEIDPVVTAALASSFREQDIVDLSEASRQWVPSGIPLIGIYLGLDTMNTSSGVNLEVGIHHSPDSEDPYAEWVYDDLSDRKEHLISGLAAMTSIYSQLDDEDLSSALDYTIPFAYGALITGAAFKDWDQTRELVVGFGFHDGDLLRLIHKTGNTIDFNCRFDFEE